MPNEGTDLQFEEMWIVRLRDTLLPKPQSGELRVKQAQAILKWEG